MTKPATLFLTSLFIFALLAAFMLTGPSPANTGTPVFSKVQQHKVVEVDAVHLEALKGKSLKTLSLYAVHDNKLTPIPFQFEEFERKDLLPHRSRPASGKKVAGVFDNHDVLVFMLKDSGDKANREQLKNLDVLSSLKLEDNGMTSYVYLVQNGEKSQMRYVHYDENTGVISMPRATIQMNPKDLLDWGDVIPLNNETIDQDTLLDCLKLRINGKLLNFNLKLNNNNLQARLKKIHEGPVRLTLDAEIRAIVAKMPLIKAEAQLHIDSSSARIYINMEIPGKYSKMIKDPVVLIAIDGYNLYGKLVRTSVTGNDTYFVDGKMDEHEKALNKMQIMEAVSWLWISDENDLNMIGQYDLSANDNFDPANFPDITVYYLDDAQKIDEPERFPGSVPALGYRLEGIPKSDTIRMSYKVLIINDMRPLTAGDFLEGLDKKVKISSAE